MGNAMRYGIFHLYDNLESDAVYQSFDDNAEQGYSLSEAMASIMSDVECTYGALKITSDCDLADTIRIVVTVRSDVYEQRWSIYHS